MSLSRAEASGVDSFHLVDKSRSPERSLSLIADDVIFYLSPSPSSLSQISFGSFHFVGLEVKNESILRWIIHPQLATLLTDKRFSDRQKMKSSIYTDLWFLLFCTTEAFPENRQDKNTFHSHTNWCLFCLWLLHPHFFAFCCCSS